MIDRDDYLAWKERTFGNGYAIWHDGLYTGAVTSLRGPERDEALTMLRAGVAFDDPHASEALAAMGDAPSRDAVLAQLTTREGAERVRAALAAHRLGADESLAEHLLDVLVRAPSWSDRIDAAMGLRHFRGEASERALLEAIEGDPEYLVRYHACESLLVRWSVRPAEIAKHRAIFALVSVPREGEPSDAQRAGYREARAKLLALRG